VPAGDHNPEEVADLIAAGESALARGEPAEAYEILTRASALPTSGALLHRLATAFAAAARHLARHEEVLEWIDRRIDGVDGDGERVPLLVARLGVYRLLDSGRVLEMCDETIGAALAIADHEAAARALSHAAFAAYRRGDARRARAFADRAGGLERTHRAVYFYVLRARMFAASAAGELEANLELSMKTRALARELDSKVDVANESNNLAETYLELGCPAEARACAQVAAQLAEAVGHAAVHTMATMYAAIARAETGEIDQALEALERLAMGSSTNGFARIDVAATHAYWLLERGAAGDARRAREIAEPALDVAIAVGADNRLTTLYACIARALARDGQDAAARIELERARKRADRGDPSAQSMHALAAAEVLPASEPARGVVLSTARARILRRAARREDPHAFCVHVRLNRRLLELSGGVPPDLPKSS
jgi:tetratricopeptide (TPR) repeat protein